MSNKSNDFTKISSKNFDAKIKNAIRDYYTYGFKSTYSGSESLSVETLRKDHKRLTDILKGYLRWSDENGRRVFHCENAQLLTTNPFHNLYKFCIYGDNDWAFLANIIMPLALIRIFKSDIKRSESINVIPMLVDCEAPIKYCMEHDDSSIDDIMERIRALFSDIDVDKGLTGAQLCSCYPDDKYNNLFTLDYKTLRRRMIKYSELGFIESKECNKKYYFKLSSATMKNIITKGMSNNNCFNKHFQRALDFYSRYYALGTIGSFLLDRMGNDNYISNFRFKHEYYMQSVNEFNLLDLLIAIEKDLVCLIRYKHGVTDVEKEILCYPLELRVSSMTGREFLMYYNPFKHAYGRLRIEFIESIDYASRQEFFDGCQLDEQRFDEEVKNSREALQKSWGVSIDARIQNATKELELKQVKMRIEYDAKAENYILNRIKREKRIGKYKINKEEGKSYIDFEVVVLDEMELRPWIRSFYTRIVSITGMYSKDFSVAADVTEIDESFNNDLKIDKKRSSDKNFTDNKFIEEIRQKVRFNPANEHDKLFNEIFSKDFYAKAEHIVDDYCRNRKLSLEQKAQLKTIDFYKDILPLTNLEKRWLATILEDAKISYFLSSDEINAIKEVVNFNQKIKLLSVNSIKYYDRFSISKNTEKKERIAVTRVLNAIEQRLWINIKYKTIRGRIYDNIFCPLTLEYSQRDNLFRGYFVNSENKVFTLNISRIIDICESNITKDISCEEIEGLLKHVKDFRMEKVTLEFYNIKNLTDRILTEFSPWKKDVSYNKDTKLYTLTLYYDKSDRLEIVNRLMGYGKIVKFVNEEDAVYEDIYERIKEQKKLI